MPVIINDFHLSLALAGFLPFSFFLAYGLISIPAGTLVEARGPRTTMLVAFSLNLLGCVAIALYPVLPGADSPATGAAFFLGIIAYVGTEQTLANWMSQFLSTYHHFSPAREGAHAVGLFWGLMSPGCLLGLVLLKLFDVKLVLAVFAVCAMGTRFCS